MENSINLNKLTKEFFTAKAADEKYSRENSAKFRAVNQRVGSYEEFCDIVAASNLNPLDRKDIYSSEKINTNWNLGYSDRQKIPDISGNISGNLPMNKVFSCDSFVKKWKLLKTEEEKFSMLLSFENNVLQKIFSNDLPSTVFEETLVVFFNLLNDQEALKYIFQVLNSFGQSKRIKLAIKFLDKNQKKMLLQIIEKLKDKCDVSELALIYGM